MLNYTQLNESSKSSRFIINTQQGNVIILVFENLENEKMHFANDFLQENVVEMFVAKASSINENYCKELAQTIKHIFDFKLEKEEQTIVYISIPKDSLKHQLMKRFVDYDDNAHFRYFFYTIEENVLCFFFNEQKISTVKTWAALTEFFKVEYGINFETKD